MLKNTFGDWGDGTVSSHLGRLAFTEVKVGSAGGDEVFKVMVNDCHF